MTIEAATDSFFWKDPKKIPLFLLIILFTIRVVLIFCHVRFYMVYAEEWFWFFLSFLALLFWFFHLEYNGRTILGCVSALCYTALYFIVGFFTHFFIGAIDEVEPEKFKNCEQEVWLQFHQGSWGGEPYETLGLGKSYFFGLMYREDAHLKVSYFNSEMPWENADRYEVPKGVDVEDCIFWEQKRLLFDMEKKICYKLHLKKKIPLTASEKGCKQWFEKKWDAKIIVEKGNCTIEPVYALNDVIYVTVDFKDTTKATSLTNTEIDRLTYEFSQILTSGQKNNEPFDTVMVYFISHDTREMYEFDYTSKYKYGRFSIDDQKTIAYKKDRDFIKKLYVPWTEFSIITYRDGRNKDQRPEVQKLSCEYHHLHDDFNLKRAGHKLYKGLNCEMYVARHPEKLRTPNGYLTCEATYLLFDEHLVNAEVIYKCYPENEHFRYQEVVSKIINPRMKDTPDNSFNKFVSTKYLDFEYAVDNTQIVCHADTTKVPWKIDCTASIQTPEFVYLYK